ncbi:AcrR family transcriptional regulator [Agrobacterium vitis]|nr:AcrR family transcriptional regulator [Agrobacterium vitis]MBE1436404.1 AcrR family transcriptional regulator [Agrobacterium vitis]
MEKNALGAPEPPKTGTKGNKRQSRKRQIVLDTARQIFMEQGYDRASMDMIATEASVSKATLYVYFENKEALLSALISEECQRFGPDPLGDAYGRVHDIETALRDIARNFTRIFMNENALGLYRLVMANASHFPEIAEVFMNAGPRRQHADLAAFFQRAIDGGLLKIDNIDLAVKQFLSLVQGDLPINWALSMTRPQQREYDALIEGGVHVFLAAYGTPRPVDG